MYMKKKSIKTTYGQQVNTYHSFVLNRQLLTKNLVRIIKSAKQECHFFLLLKTGKRTLKANFEL